MRLRSLALVMVVLMTPIAILAQHNVSLELTEETLNGMVRRMGVRSRSGVFQPYSSVTLEGFKICEPVGFIDCFPLGGGSAFPGFRGGAMGLMFCHKVGGGVQAVPIGDAIIWNWWIEDVYYTLRDGSMELEATVRAVVDGVATVSRHTIDAWVSFSGAEDKVKVNVRTLSVPLEYAHEDGRTFTATSVDVSGMCGFAVPIEAQTMDLPPIEGGDSVTIKGEARSMSVDYEAGKIALHFDVSFTEQ